MIATEASSPHRTSTEVPNGTDLILDAGFEDGTADLLRNFDSNVALWVSEPLGTNCPRESISINW